MSRQEEQFRLECLYIEHETDSAILVTIESRGNIWIPLSQVCSIHRDNPPYLMITPWIARQKNLL